MKKNIIINSICLGAIFSLSNIFGTNVAFAQGAAKKSLSVSLAYSTVNNNIPFVVITAKSKIDGKFKPIKGIEYQVFLDKDSVSGKGIGAMGKAVTNDKGMVAVTINPALAQQWKSNPSHTFMATSVATKEFDESSAELTVGKSKIDLDTADDKNLVATFSEFKNNAWVPVKGIELKLGIKRQGADLQISDDQSYTTDSLGQVKAEFKRLGLPGDEKGNIILVAKVEDNDQYGNLRVEKTLPWGKKFSVDNNFFRRALWASRFHSPFWLVFMAYSIVIGVWGTIIYLIFLLIKIKKLGKEA